MRIGFLLDSFEIGGTELNAVKLAESLSGHSVTLTAFHFQQQGPLRARYQALGIELIHVPLQGLLSASARDAVRQISTMSAERNLQLLHSHCVYSNILGIPLRRLTRHSVPLLASRRWTGYSARQGLHTLNRIAQSAADAVLVNAPSLLAVVERESPFSVPVYIPNLLPDRNFVRPASAERSKARVALGLSPEALIVGCVARLVPVKDHATLLRAWRAVALQFPAAQLAIMGGGELRASLEAMAREFGIDDSVRFTGEVAPELLPQSLLDITVLTSLDEGFPNSLLEAMAQGIPIVSTNVGGVPDLVRHGTNGILVEKGDATALGQQLIGLLSGAIPSQELVAGGLVTASTHKGSVVRERLLELYRKLATR